MNSLLEFLQHRLGFLVLTVIYHFVKSTTTLKWQYFKLYELYGPFHILVFGTLLVSLFSYLSFSLWLFFIDVWIYPNFFHKLRVQNQTQPNFQGYKRCWKVVLFNLVGLGFPFSYIFYYLFHPISKLYKNDTSRYLELPTTFQTIWQVGICILVEEVLFYYSHRLFHLKWFYQKFHKRHHEFLAPIGLSAVYTTPIDFLVSNLFPLLVGPLLTQAHPITVMFYFTIAIINTVVTHGGYTLFGLPDAKLHDFHHETFDSMYGVIGVLDYVHGTDKKFRQRYNNNETVKSV